jgi:hypothetical protein
MAVTFVRDILMKMYSVLQIFILLGLSQTASAAETCFPFMPEKSTIQGRITQETPPSTKDAAKPEPYYVMNLSTPICVAPSEKDTTNKGSAQGVSKIQLTFRGMKQEMFGKLKPRLLSDEIKCTGSFFYGHMAHHHTRVLMWTQECAAVGAKAPDIAL